MRQLNAFHTFASYFSNIHLNVLSYLRLGLSSGLFPSDFLKEDSVIGPVS